MFPTDTLQQKIKIPDLKPVFVGENVLLYSTVYLKFRKIYLKNVNKKMFNKSE